MNQQIYLNYAATSAKKPQKVIDAVCRYLQKNNEVNEKRNYTVVEGDLLYTAREALSTLFNSADSSRVIFTGNVTMSLNMILNGLLDSKDHVITSSIEHNAVLRPLHLLEKNGVEMTQISCYFDGQIEMDNLKKAFQSNTKVLVLSHASNVLGTILPIKECFKLAKERGVLTVLDVAQTAGYLDIDMEDLQADVIAFTGHKSLYALSGIGGFIMSEEAKKKMKPWLVGGTGSASLSKEQPDFLPDRFESGTLNSLGIYSLTKSIEWLQETQLTNIRQKETKLYDLLIEGLRLLPVKILGTQNNQKSVPLVSIVPEKISSNELADILYRKYNIVTRCGLHCAPDAHKVAGTLTTGALRFSIGYETTEKEIDDTLKALKEVLL